MEMGYLRDFVRAGVRVMDQQPFLRARFVLMRRCQDKFWYLAVFYLATLDVV
jgi:hypothetical protein